MAASTGWRDHEFEMYFPADPASLHSFLLLYQQGCGLVIVPVKKYRLLIIQFFTGTYGMAVPVWTPNLNPSTSAHVKKFGRPFYEEYLEESRMWKDIFLTRIPGKILHVKGCLLVTFCNPFTSSLSNIYETDMHDPFTIEGLLLRKRLNQINPGVNKARGQLFVKPSFISSYRA